MPGPVLSTRRPIRLLGATLINQIAAGEVIVRPASAVKELVENALDAEATRIGITVAADGRDITVTDDGLGIAAAEIETALLRHATSKIETFEDLSALQSRGFRGEALASIASVARVRLTSRPPGAAMAVQVEVRAGEVIARHPLGAPHGTRVEVEELFANVPARRKFLRSPQAEFNAILRIVVQQALSAPETGFTLERDADGQRTRVIELPAGQTLRDRLAQVLGAQVAEHLVPVGLAEGDFLLTGFVARPLQSRRDTRGQFFFVNGRPIANRRLGFALRQACEGMIMTGRQPMAALYLECPAASVDVNVHPTKDEVRFESEDRIAGHVYHAVQAALLGTDLRPRLDLGAPPPVPYAAPAESLERSPAPLPLWGAQAAGLPSAPGAQGTISLTVSSAPLPSPPHGADVNVAVSSTSRSLAPPQETTVLDPLIDDPSIITPLGQISDTYIVAACGDGLLLIDQHAAHERLMFVKVQERFAQQRQATQPLLVPLSFDLPATSLSHLDVIARVFAEIGIDLDAFGGQTVIVRALPADFEKVDIAAVVQDVAADLERGAPAPAPAQVRDRILTRMACHAAIKAHRRLTPEEMRGLIDEIVRARLPHTCPHGRPTMALVTLEQLDRQFKRK